MNGSFMYRLLYNRLFWGLGGEVFILWIEDDDDKSKVWMMENVFLVLDNLLVLVNDYLYGYWEYLKGLMSLFIIYIGLGDELISDDGFDECKCFF